MTPIPRAAMPVVRVLRRDVKRPGMPRCHGGYEDSGRYWRRARWHGEATCPMGLHPDAHSFAPNGRVDFPPADTLAVREFADWWDNLDRADIPAAMDAIWGPK